MASNYSRADILSVIVAEQRRGYPSGHRPPPDGTTVRKEMNDMGSKQKLREGVERLDGPCPPGTEAHHIVPETMAAAQSARDILAAAEISIDDPANGICLARDSSVENTSGSLIHDTMHSKEYCNFLTRILEEAWNKHHSQHDVFAALARLKVSIYRASSDIPGGNSSKYG